MSTECPHNIQRCKESSCPIKLLKKSSQPPYLACDTIPRGDPDDPDNQASIQAYVEMYGANMETVLARMRAEQEVFNAVHSGQKSIRAALLDFYEEHILPTRNAKNN